MREGLTYDDVLIVPKYSDIETRNDIDITSEYLGSNRLPIISAPMDYVTGPKMAMELSRLNAYGIISRFGGAEIWPVTSETFEFGRAIGAKDPDLNDLEDAHSICIDVAHGHHSLVERTVKTLQDAFPDVPIIAGNVATADGFRSLAEWGVNAVRVGIGPGSACSTRENTGVGVPQLTAVLDCVNMRHDWGFYETSIIADGGIQKPGDIVKALAAGADAVMLGNLLAGHEESPGEVFYSTTDRKYYKHYQGQSLLGSNGARNAPEGISGTVPYRGNVADTINTLTNYIRSGMSYVGARNLNELVNRADFIKVSPGTINESRTRL